MTTETPLVIPNTTLVDQFVKRGTYGFRVFTADKDYALPTREWVLKKFYPWWHAKAWNEGFDKWNPANDCDDFSRYFAVCAQHAHYQTRGANAQGIAVGEFWYNSRTLGFHAINAFLCEDLSLAFIEPQNGLEVTCTPDEMRSALFVRF